MMDENELIQKLNSRLIEGNWDSAKRLLLEGLNQARLDEVNKMITSMTIEKMEHTDLYRIMKNRQKELKSTLKETNMPL